MWLLENCFISMKNFASKTSIVQTAIHLWFSIIKKKTQQNEDLESKNKGLNLMLQQKYRTGKKSTAALGLISSQHRIDSITYVSDYHKKIDCIRLCIYQNDQNLKH